MTNARLTAVLVAVLVCSPAVGSVLAAGSTAPADPTRIDHEGELLTLQTEAGQTITGTTNLSEGETVTVTVRGTGGSPFLRRASTTVGPDGDFSVTMDFSELDAEKVGTPTLTVGQGATRLASIGVEFTPGPGPEPDPQSDEDDGGDDDGENRRDVDEDGVAFSALIVQTYAGDTVAIPIRVGDVGEAVLKLGDEEVNYVMTARVEDGDGDGAVTVVFDTGHASNESRVAAAKSDADAVTVTNVAGTAAPLNQDDVTLDPTEYPMSLYRIDDGERDEVDVGTLDVTSAGDGEDAPDDGGGSGRGDADAGDDGNRAREDPVAGQQSDDSLPAEPSTVGLAVVALVALGVAGGLTLFRR